MEGNGKMIGEMGGDEEDEVMVRERVLKGVGGMEGEFGMMGEEVGGEMREMLVEVVDEEKEWGK